MMNEPEPEAIASGETLASDTPGLENLLLYKVLDTLPEPVFDKITALALQIFDVAASEINFVTDDGVFTKAGTEGSEALTQRVKRLSMLAVLSEDVTILENLNSTIDNGFGEINFYAAAPLKSKKGFNLGVICLYDIVPRTFEAEDLKTLEWLAAMASRELEKRF